MGGRAHPPAILAEIAMLSGEYAEAARCLRICCNRIEEDGNLGVLSTYLPGLGRCLCLLGRYDEAEPLAQRGRELGGVDDAVTQFAWRQVLALVCSHRGQHKEAERLAREAVAIAQQTDGLSSQGDTLCDLAEVLQQAGREQEAAVTLQQALDRYTRKKNLAMVAQVQRRMRSREDQAPSV